MTSKPAASLFRNRSADPALFKAVRGSKDVTLVAFGAALLTAFALQAGAFLPRLKTPTPAPAIERAPARATPELAASHRPSAVEGGGAAAVAAPCETPRG
jgi:hypothetical protein